MSSHITQRVLDPKTFIRPPFLPCPSCGAEQFGVLMINKNSYYRRCRACWHDQGFRLPPIRKKVIYLDQWVISNFLNTLDPSLGKTGKVPPFYKELFERLERLIKLQLVVCPTSPIHRNESIVAAGFVPKLQRLFVYLAQGASFALPSEIKLRQVRSVLERWQGQSEMDEEHKDASDALEGNPHGWKERMVIFTPWHADADGIADVEQHREAVTDGLGKLFQQWQQNKGLKFKTQFEAGLKEWPISIMKAAVDQKRTRYARVMQGELSLDDAFRNFDEDVLDMVEVAVRTGTVIPDEVAKQIRAFYHSPEFTQMPFLRAASFMMAALAVNASGGQVKEPNQGTVNDINAVAIYGPYCDAMLVDNACRELARPRQGLNAGLKARLFSMNSKSDFVSYLEKVEQSAPQEHLDMVLALYGAEYLETYSSMFNH